MEYKFDYIYQSTYSELCLEYLYTVEESVTFMVQVKSYDFSGKYNFCLREELIKNYILNLKNMNKSLKGFLRIEDNDSDSFLHLEIVGNKFNISGQLGGSYNDNFMKFAFSADQTIIKLLIETLSSYLSS